MLETKFEAILPHLDERQRRLLLGAEARALGYGGWRTARAMASPRASTLRCSATVRGG